MNQVDLFSAVMNLCNVRATFRQNFAQDALTISESLFFPYLDFTPLIHEVERFGGYGYILAPSMSRGASESDALGLTDTLSRQYGLSQSRGRAFTTMIGRTINSQVSVSESEIENWIRTAQQAKSLSLTQADMSAVTQAHGQGEALSQFESHGTHHGQIINTGVSQFMQPNFVPQITDHFSTGNASGTNDSSGSGKTTNKHDSTAVTRGRGNALQQGILYGDGFGRGGAIGKTTGSAWGIADTIAQAYSKSMVDTYSFMLGTSRSIARSLAQGHNYSVTFSLSPIALPPRVEQQDTGRLKMSVDDQFWRFAALIGNLPKRHCIVSIRDYNSVFTLRVADVYDPFELIGCSPKLRHQSVKSFVTDMMHWHDCFFLPPEISEEQGAEEKVEDHQRPFDDDHPFG